MKKSIITLIIAIALAIGGALFFYNKYSIENNCTDDGCPSFHEAEKE